MELVPIFATFLYAIRYDSTDADEVNEFEKLFYFWDDVEYLEEFFANNKADLQSGFYGNISIEQAVEITIQEAYNLEKEIIRLCELTVFEQIGALSTLFKPLSNLDYKIVDLGKSKAKGNLRKSWLRIYAIKISEDKYVVTGGTIKLTATMKEREHTRLELRKLERGRNFLLENGLIDESAFMEFEI